MRKTRILMFGWEFPPHHSGGLGVACMGLTRALAEHNYEILFVMPRRLDVAAPWVRFVFADADADDAGARLETYVVNSSLVPYLSGALYKSRSEESAIYAPTLIGEVLRYAALGGRIARSETFDIIYAHEWMSFGAGIEAKKATGKPLIVHVHATEVDRCGGSILNVNPQVYELERRGLEAADVIISVSQFTKSIIVRDYGISPEKVRVVYNGIDDATTPSGDNTLSRLNALKAAGYRIVLFMGRLTLHKGPDYFLRTAARVLEFEPKVVFVISGSGDMEEQLIHQAAALGIGQSVFFAGFLNGHDRYEIYRAADLFVMPSVSEPFGIVPLEAVKLGTSVIISKQSGVSEVLRNALKSDFWDVDNMANQIVAMLRHAALRETMMHHARAEADLLTWGRAAEGVDAIIHTLREAMT